MTSEAYLGLGSNLGDKAAAVLGAAERLAACEGVLQVELSPLYRTAPVGKLDQDWFVNAVARARTSLEPRALLQRCLEIERHFKRERLERWGPRTLDIDLLLYDQRVVEEEGLVVPHPRLLERAFALAPLVDLSPDASIAGTRAREWLARLDQSGVQRL